MDQTCPVVHNSRRPQARLKTVTVLVTLTYIVVFSRGIFFSKIVNIGVMRNDRAAQQRLFSGTILRGLTQPLNAYGYKYLSFLLLLFYPFVVPADLRILKLLLKNLSFSGEYSAIQQLLGKIPPTKKLCQFEDTFSIRYMRFMRFLQAIMTLLSLN
jgi:hypothetical protein